MSEQFTNGAEKGEKSYFNEVSMLSSAIDKAGLNNSEEVIAKNINREDAIEQIAIDLFGEGYPEHEVHDIISAYYGQE